MTVSPLLRLALLARRQDPLRLFALGLIVVAVTTAFFVLPAREAALAAAVSELTQLTAGTTRASSAKRATEPENRLLAFRAVLGPRNATEQHIEAVLAIARDTGLSVQKAEYRKAFSKSGNYHQYQAVLPFRSSYGSVRAFCDEVLRSLPFAAIDAVQFSRSTVDVADLDAKVSLTLYLTEDDSYARRASPPSRSVHAIPIGAVVR